MATRAYGGFLGDELLRLRLARGARSGPIHPVVRRRRQVAAGLTLLLVGLGVALLVSFGPESLAAYAPALPVALVLLWASTSALRFDEREVHDEREREVHDEREREVRDEREREEPRREAEERPATAT